MCDNNFLSSLVASLLSWRFLAVPVSYFLHAAINLRPPSVTVSTHISASNTVAFQPPATSNARMSFLYKKMVHSVSFPPHPLHTAPSRFPNSIRFGGRAQLIRMSTPAHKSFFVRSVVSVLSHRVISRARSVVRGHPVVWSLALCLDDVKYLLSVHFNIIHRNRKRSLYAQLRVQDEFLEKNTRYLL